MLVCVVVGVGVVDICCRVVVDVCVDVVDVVVVGGIGVGGAVLC